MCSGKCYLSQQLEEAEEPHQQDLPLSSRLKMEIQLFIEALRFNLRPMTWASTQKTEFPDNSILPDSTYPDSVFHPPETHFLFS